MSEDRGVPFFAFLAGAFAGAAVGAALALLYAPKAGTELRAQIRDEAQERLDKASAQWDKAMKQMQQSMSDLQTEVRGYLEQAQEKVSSATPKTG